jgi:hypothetical protein
MQLVQYIEGMSGFDRKVPLRNLPPFPPGVREVVVWQALIILTSATVPRLGGKV